MRYEWLSENVTNVERWRVNEGRISNVIVGRFKLTDGKRVFIRGTGRKRKKLQMIELSDLLKEENSQINYDGQQQQMWHKIGKQRSESKTWGR